MTWSERYYTGLTEAEHEANNAWFKEALYSLKDTGILIVPNIGKTFNKQGEESAMYGQWRTCTQCGVVSNDPDDFRYGGYMGYERYLMCLECVDKMNTLVETFVIVDMKGNFEYL